MDKTDQSLASIKKDKSIKDNCLKSSQKLVSSPSFSSQCSQNLSNSQRPIDLNIGIQSQKNDNQQKHSLKQILNTQESPHSYQKLSKDGLSKRSSTQSAIAENKQILLFDASPLDSKKNNLDHSNKHEPLNLFSKEQIPEGVGICRNLSLQNNIFTRNSDDIFFRKENPFEKKQLDLEIEKKNSDSNEGKDLFECNGQVPTNFFEKTEDVDSSRLPIFLSQRKGDSQIKGNTSDIQSWKDKHKLNKENRSDLSLNSHISILSILKDPNWKEGIRKEVCKERSNQNNSLIAKLNKVFDSEDEGCCCTSEKKPEFQRELSSQFDINQFLHSQQSPAPKFTSLRQKRLENRANAFKGEDEYDSSLFESDHQIPEGRNLSNLEEFGNDISEIFSSDNILAKLSEIKKGESQNPQEIKKTAERYQTPISDQEFLESTEKNDEKNSQESNWKDVLESDQKQFNASYLVERYKSKVSIEEEVAGEERLANSALDRGFIGETTEPEIKEANQNRTQDLPNSETIDESLKHIISFGGIDSIDSVNFQEQKDKFQISQYFRNNNISPIQSQGRSKIERSKCENERAVAQKEEDLLLNVQIKNEKGGNNIVKDGQGSSLNSYGHFFENLSQEAAKHSTLKMKKSQGEQNLHSQESSSGNSQQYIQLKAEIETPDIQNKLKILLEESGYYTNEAMKAVINEIMTQITLGLVIEKSQILAAENEDDEEIIEERHFDELKRHVTALIQVCQEYEEIDKQNDQKVIKEMLQRKLESNNSLTPVEEDKKNNQKSSNRIKRNKLKVTTETLKDKNILSIHSIKPSKKRAQFAMEQSEQSSSNLNENLVSDEEDNSLNNFFQKQQKNNKNKKLKK